MKSNDRKRAYAERLYVDDAWTAKAIADTVGVSETTVGNWVKKYGWKEKQDELAAAPHRVKRLILEQLTLAANGEKTTVNTDDISKLTTALERVDKKVNVQMVISVLKELDNWLAGSQDVNTEFLTASLELHKNFIKHKIDQELV